MKFVFLLLLVTLSVVATKCAPQNERPTTSTTTTKRPGEKKEDLPNKPGSRNTRDTDSTTTTTTKKPDDKEEDRSKGGRGKIQKRDVTTTTTTTKKPDDEEDRSKLGKVLKNVFLQLLILRKVTGRKLAQMLQTLLACKIMSPAASVV